MDQSRRLETSLVLDGNVYSGDIGCIEGEIGCNLKILDQGDLFLEISGQDVTFTYEMNTICWYPDQAGDPCFSCEIGDPCEPATFTGVGTISDEIVIEIDYNGKDCGGSHEVTIQLIRTPKWDEG